MRFLGIDLALNHAGFVLLEEAGVVVGHEFVTDKPSHAKHARGVLLPKSSSDDKHTSEIERLLWWRHYLDHFLAEWQPEYVGLEDYAFMARSNSACQIGELGGVARVAILSAKARLRLFGPMQGKIWATGSGSADGFEVATAVRLAIGDIFASCNPPAKGAKQNTLVEEDLAAAYAMAQMARAVWQLQRNGAPAAVLTAHQVRSLGPQAASRPWLVAIPASLPLPPLAVPA